MLFVTLTWVAFIVIVLYILWLFNPFEDID